MSSHKAVEHTAANLDGLWTVIAKTRNFDNEVSSSKKAIVVIPGNPGLVEFYELFMECLYKLKGIPIIGFSHAGHSPIHPYTDEPMRTPPLTLQEQIQHKKDCVRQFIPDDCNIIFIGHSIGAYIILQLMDHIPERSLHGILLFPTITNMIGTVDGKFWNLITSYLKLPLLWTAYFSSYLPYALQDVLIRWRAKWRQIDAPIVPVCRRCVSWDVLSQGFRMVECELVEVKTLNPELSRIIRRYSNKLTVYYGDGDAWTPFSFYEEFIQKFPEVKTFYGRDGFKHDFVLDSSEGVARLCNKFIEKL
ncbi:lipid droplet-associated hydrolase-like [Clytia hemisphaerica]|uniref:Lipid droplet-associated hydrolase n=1 Tax=Clytia hemisphaerica TaxID=252671 RepID=A0A7M5V9Y7_9CNID|eukprot:TCONS_00000014-protein